MARQAAPMQKNCTRYTQAHKDEALALADRIGVTAAARELIHASPLYQRRTKGSISKVSPQTECTLIGELDIEKRLRCISLKPEMKRDFR